MTTETEYDPTEIEYDPASVASRMFHMYTVRVMIPWLIFCAAVVIGVWYATSSLIAVLGTVAGLIGIDYVASRHIAPKLYAKFHTIVVQTME